MTRSIATLSLWAFILTGPMLQAKDTGCGAADFVGTYALVIKGLILPGLPNSGDFARLGTVVADGHGNIVATTVADYNGNNVQENFAGTYEVRDNCGVTWRAVLPTGSIPVTIDGALTADGDKVALFVSSPEGVVLQGVLEKQEPSGCVTADLSGGHTLKLAGRITYGLPLVGSFSRVGRLVFDGAGAVYIDTIVSYAGALLREQFYGTYSVDSNCHMKLEAALPWPLLFGITLEGELSAERSHILLMQTAPAGTAVTGELSKQ